MIVLHINAVYGIGSTGTIVHDLHMLSIENGFKSFVVYSSSNIPKDLITNGYKMGTNFDKKIHALLCRINGKQAYFSIMSTRKLLTYLYDIKPDVVHLHNLHSNYINLNMLLNYLSTNNIPTVITLHDCWFYTGGCFHYTMANCYNWIESCGNCPKKLSDTPALLFDKSSEILLDRKRYLTSVRDLKVVGVSKWISEEARRTFLRNKEISYIYNGIDMDVFKYIESNIKTRLKIENKFVVLGYSNKWLDPINYNFVLDISSSIDDDMIIVIFGCKDEARINSVHNIIYIDYTNDRNEICKIFSMADVFINCTREDSLSLVNLEAQSCGTPVITFRNTGAKETVNEICSFSVIDGDSFNTLKNIFQIKERGKEYFSEDCRKWIKSKFNKNANYLKYIDAYKELKKTNIEDNYGC